MRPAAIGPQLAHYEPAYANAPPVHAVAIALQPERESFVTLSKRLPLPLARTIMRMLEQIRGCEPQSSSSAVKQQVASTCLNQQAEDWATDNGRPEGSSGCKKIVIIVAKICTVVALLALYNQHVVYQIESVSSSWPHSERLHAPSKG